MSPECVPFARMGNHEGFCHISNLTYFVAVYKLKAHCLGFMEEALDFPVEDLAEKLAPEYELHKSVFGPREVGEPIDRKRVQLALVRKETVIFTGSAIDFRDSFFRHTVMGSGEYFCAPEEVVQAEFDA